MVGSVTPRFRRTLTYAGIFLVAQATLMLEVLLTRITSVSAWYHLAFFVISLAMLGMTAGAVAVFLWPQHFEDDVIPERLAQSSLGFAVAIPVCVAIALSLPLAPVTDLMSFVALLGTGGLLALPFMLGGVTLTLALTRAGLPASVAYGVDLIGAASGCAMIIAVLSRIDAPSAALFSAALAALASFAFSLATGQRARLALVACLALGALCFANANAAQPPLRPAWVKGLREDPRAFDFVRWNSYSRVTVRKALALPPALWARGRNTPPEVLAPVEQRLIEIDGAAGTVMTFIGRSPGDHPYLSWDVTSAAHTLRPSGPAAVIGVGGGRDLIAAAQAGHKPVVGIELNDIIVDLHRLHMGAFSGLLRVPGIEIISDEARSHLARDRRNYEVITMSLIDTWASTGTGAYSLSENGLYTLDAWRIFLSRLSPGGIFSVSRWYVVQSPGETARMLALAMDSIWDRGGADPRQHIILLQNDLVATLLLTPTPFTPADIDAVQKLAVEKGFNMLATPRRAPDHPLLRALWSQRGRAAMHAWSARQQLDLTPPTDARPFFFNMLKPATWLEDRNKVDQMDLSFLGNLQATQTLLYATLASVILTLLTLVFPMARRMRALRVLPMADVAAALGYFALIGLGFMFVEIALLSRLNVFLGHPTLALAVLLGGIIFFTGIGSLCSARIDVTNPRWARLYPLIPATLVVLTGFFMMPLMQAFQASATATRILLSIALLCPPALGLGLCFPLGLRLTERMEQALGGSQERPRLGPWLWGINGAFGVCASGLALATSMVWGIGTTLLVGATCYVLLTFMTARLVRAV